MPPLTTFDVIKAMELPLLLPAFLAALVLLTDDVLTLRFPGLWPKWFPLLYAGRTLVPMTLLAWLITQDPGMLERVGVNWPESPWGIMENVAAATVLFALTFGFWKWVYGSGNIHSLVWGQALPRSGVIGLLLASGDALSQQVAFALLRLPAYTESMAWVIVLALSIVLIVWDVALADGGKGFLTCRAALKIVGVMGGTGLVLNGYSLWMAVLWYWAMIAFACPNTTEP